MSSLQWMTDPVTFTVLAALLGVSVGSFLNVVIHRVPAMLERAGSTDVTVLLEEAVEALAVKPDFFPAMRGRTECLTALDDLMAYTERLARAGARYDRRVDLVRADGRGAWGAGLVAMPVGAGRGALRRGGVLRLREIDAQPVNRARVPLGHADRAGGQAGDANQHGGQRLGFEAEHQATPAGAAGGAAARVWNVRPAM
mgnify:CR=1 FL=1